MTNELHFLSIWLKLFFVLTPPFGLTMFLSMTQGYEEPRRRKLAFVVTFSVTFLSLILFFAGRQIFALFGITVDSFRIGAGALLFLSGVGLVKGNHQIHHPDKTGDIAVVPLATPIIVGPATMGTLLVMGSELEGFIDRAIGCLALLLAVAGIGAILLMGSLIHRILGDRGINVLSKLTGLILCALAAQMIMTGVQGFMGIS